MKMNSCIVVWVSSIHLILVLMIPCGVSMTKITFCHSFPYDLFKSSTIKIACGYQDTRDHPLGGQSPIERVLYRDLCWSLDVMSGAVECTVYPDESNTDPRRNPTFIALESPTGEEPPLYDPQYLLKDDGVYIEKHGDNNQKKYQFYQTWDWPVKYEILIYNDFSDRRLLTVNCHFDKENRISYVIHHDVSKAMFFIVNISPDEENKVPCAVDWPGRHKQYARNYYSFFALDKQRIAREDYRPQSAMLTLAWHLGQDGMYHEDLTTGHQSQVESWREDQSESSISSSANEMEITKSKIPRFIFSKQKTKYSRREWNRKYMNHEYMNSAIGEYSSAYENKAWYT